MNASILPKVKNLNPDLKSEVPVKDPQTLVGFKNSSKGLYNLILRANPFPKVTDLFCRLPLSTLLYQLEAAHLGDLMRL